MESQDCDEMDEVKTTMNDEEAENLRSRVIELLQLQQKSDAISIYEAICLDQSLTHIATIGRVKQICKDLKAEEVKKLKAKDDQKRLSEQSKIKFQDSLPLWPKGKPVRDALDTGDTSIFSVAEKMQATLGSTNTMGKDPFFDFRESLLAIASNYDAGNRLNIMQDEKQSSGIVIVVHSIRTQTNGSPLFYIEWSHNLRSDPHFAPMIQMLMCKYKQTSNIKATLDEQKLWLVELQRSIRKDFHCEHKLMKRSCILSPQPAKNPDYESVKNPSTKDSRLCGHCRGRASFNCSVCLGVQYCSKECQKLDWKLHKIVCNAKPIDDKNSVVIPVVASLGVGSENFFCETSFTGSGVSTHKPTDIAKNPYGNARFIIKCQITIGPLDLSRQQGILIYDKGKLLHRFLDPLEQVPHLAIHNVVYTKGYNRNKIYLLAKREGSNLRIYISDIPDQSVYIGVW
jgi:hypothetical protein